MGMGGRGGVERKSVRKVLRVFFGQKKKKKKLIPSSSLSPLSFSPHLLPLSE